MTRTIVLLPAFNEEASIGNLLNDFKSMEASLRAPLQLVIVNDGSTDQTVGVIERYRSILPIDLVSHPTNKGLAQAIRTGLAEALTHAESDDDVVIIMDADHTHPPEYIPEMVAKIQKGNDIVIASRYRPGSKQIGVPLLRKFYSRAAKIFFQIFFYLPNVWDYTCGYRAYRVSVLRQAMQHFGDQLITRSGFACTDELLVKLSLLTHKIGEIAFTLRYDRKRGRSKIRIVKTALETLRMLLQYRRSRSGKRSG
jgi:dolichol-phosphate mannosyltransferase